MRYLSTLVVVTSLAAGTLQLANRSAAASQQASAFQTAAPLYLVTATTGGPAKIWLLSTGGWAKVEYLDGQSGAQQVEGESQRTVTVGGSDHTAMTDLWLSPPGSDVAPGLVIGKPTPSAAEWTLTTSTSPYPCQAWDCLTFPNPAFFRVVLGAKYRGEVRHLSCYAASGCPEYTVVNGSTRFDGQNAEIVEATFGGLYPAADSSTAGEPPRQTFWWISKASDEVLQLQSHDPVAGTTTVTYHWQRLTATNCNDLVVSVPRSYKFVPSAARTAAVPHVPTFSCPSS